MLTKCQCLLVSYMASTFRYAARCPLCPREVNLFSLMPKTTHKKSAKLYKSSILHQFKAQTCQMSSHKDEHYFISVFKYVQQTALTYKDSVRWLCIDAKSQVDIDKPGLAVNMGVNLLFLFIDISG